MNAMDFLLGVAALPDWFGWLLLAGALIGVGALLKADA